MTLKFSDNAHVVCIFYNILDISVYFHKYSYAIIYEMYLLELINQLLVLKS